MTSLRYRRQAAADRLAQILYDASVEPVWVETVDEPIVVLAAKTRLVYDVLGEPTGDCQVIAELRRRVLSGEYRWTDNEPKDDRTIPEICVTENRTGTQIRVVLT